MLGSKAYLIIFLIQNGHLTYYTDWIRDFLQLKKKIIRNVHSIACYCFVGKIKLLFC